MVNVKRSTRFKKVRKRTKNGILRTYYVLKPQYKKKPKKRRVKKKAVYFEDIDRFVECDIYKREELPLEFSFEGPAVVYQMDTTTLVYSGQRATIDEFGYLVIEEESI